MLTEFLFPCNLEFFAPFLFRARKTFTLLIFATLSGRDLRLNENYKKKWKQVQLLLQSSHD